jgi:hypothetical protein
MASEDALQIRIDELEGLQERLVEGLLFYADESLYVENDSGDLPGALVDQGDIAREAIEAASRVTPLSVQVARLEAVVRELGGDLADVARIQRKEIAKELSWDLLDPTKTPPPS